MLPQNVWTSSSIATVGKHLLIVCDTPHSTIAYLDHRRPLCHTTTIYIPGHCVYCRSQQFFILHRSSHTCTHRYSLFIIFFSWYLHTSLDLCVNKMRRLQLFCYLYFKHDCAYVCAYLLKNAICVGSLSVVCYERLNRGSQQIFTFEKLLVLMCVDKKCHRYCWL